MGTFQFKIRAFLILLISCFSLAGCGQEQKHTVVTDTLSKDWNQSIAGNFSTQSKAVFDSLQVSVFFNTYRDLASTELQVREFYRKRGFAYAWYDHNILIEQADNLANRVRNMENDGINKTIPYQKELDSMLYAINTSQSPQSSPETMLELMLTAHYFAFAKYAWTGMNTSASEAGSWYLPRKKIDYNSYLDSLLDQPERKFSAKQPVYRQYELLREFLRKYRAIDANDDWTPLTIDLTLLKQGDTSAMLTPLKIRLGRLGDFKGDSFNNTFDNDLITALKQFQYRNGLAADGVLNKETIDAVNVPVKTRIKQILVNMERSRWLPVRLNSDYLAVNIPEFQLHVYHADSLLWSCKVVVGQSVHQTTVFYGEVKYVVFSPYWNVPQSIVLKEVIPGLRNDKAYIRKHDMEITGYHGKIPVVRQKPGPENSLGLVKFLFPNSYDIYLHDTPMKFLFGENARAFSHGCIRVVEPVKLARFLLKNNNEWNPGNIALAMHSGKERYVTLKQKVPVFIAYFTAFTDRNGLLNFRNDIYNLDDQLASMILSGSGEY